MLFPYYCVLQNGQIRELPPETFRLHDTKAQFESSPRVFTSFLAIRKGNGENSRHQIVGLDLHIDRLLTNADSIGVKHINDSSNAPLEPRSAVARLIEQFRRFNALFQARLPERYLGRLVLGQNSAELFLDSFEPRWVHGTAIKLWTYEGERENPSCKSTATELSRTAHEHAKANGAHEGLLFTKDGISEGAWSNFFWFEKDGSLYTRGDKVLPGVTRHIVFNEYSLDYKTLLPNDLKALAYEAFISMSTYGLVPVQSIDDWKLPGLDESLNYKSLRSHWLKSVEDYACEI